MEGPSWVLGAPILGWRSSSQEPRQALPLLTLKVMLTPLESNCVF